MATTGPEFKKPEPSARRQTLHRTLCDGGIEVSLGDDLGGYEATENVPSVADVIPWLQEAIAHFYPTSTYAQSLGRTSLIGRRGGYSSLHKLEPG